MNIDVLTKEFLVDTAKELDPSLQKYRSQAKILEDDIDLDKIDELKEYWNHDIPIENEYDFILRMTYSEKQLLRLWSKIFRLKQLRVTVGCKHMQLFSITNKSDDNK